MEFALWLFHFPTPAEVRFFRLCSRENTACSVQKCLWRCFKHCIFAACIKTDERIYIRHTSVQSTQSHNIKSQSFGTTRRKISFIAGDGQAHVPKSGLPADSWFLSSCNAIYGVQSLSLLSSQDAMTSLLCSVDVRWWLSPRWPSRLICLLQTPLNVHYCNTVHIPYCIVNQSINLYLNQVMKTHII